MCIQAMWQSGVAGSVVFMTLAALGCAGSNPQRIGFEEARQMFASRGVQPGQPLPDLSLVDLDGQPADIRKLQGDRPMVLLTASLTCNVARRRQPMADELGDELADLPGLGGVLAVVYTIDAHPTIDPCPYTGKEWVPQDNVKDHVLIRQPTTLQERIDAARQYRYRFSKSALILVDDMENSSWHALGEAPNLGLLVDREGMVRLRQGWFEAQPMRSAVQELAKSQGP